METVVSTRKKVIVRTLQGQLHWGYLPVSGLRSGDEVELLLPDGRAMTLRFNDIKHIAYVRDFNPADPGEPERLTMRSFPSKPRGGGLWVRVQFATGDTLEGLLHSGLPLLDMFADEGGVFLEPPDRSGNTQRLFLPRPAITALEVLGVAGSATPPRRKAATADGPQPTLFER